MILNCLHCGKAISSKMNICPYCTTDLTIYAAELDDTNLNRNKKALFKERHKGTLAAYTIR